MEGQKLSRAKDAPITMGSEQMHIKMCGISPSLLGYHDGICARER